METLLKIDTSTLTKLTEIEVLGLFKTGISEIEFVSSLNQLKNLQVDHNRIRDLRPLLPLVDSIETLNINNNCLKFTADSVNKQIIDSLLDKGTVNVQYERQLSEKYCTPE